MAKDDVMEGITLFLAVLISIGIGALFYGWNNRCPGCKRLFAKQFSIKLVNRSLLKENTYELHIWKRNLLTDFKIVPFKRVYFVRVYLDHYRCSRCGYEYSLVSKELTFKDIELDLEGSDH
ncbi:MAG: hypothetical protein DRN92_02700 [Thermoproteota archaeon]|nr:MAG: hypothetical protein DRN92_02700 [Candidatus Korarchaeota archaeon]